MSNIEQYLPFWEKLNDSEKKIISNNTKTVTYAKGEHIHNPGKQCLGALIITGGCIRVYILSQDGREVTLFRQSAGELCLLSATCVLEQITFDVFIDADCETNALVINAPVVSSVSESNVYAENFFYKIAAQRFSDILWSLQQILFLGLDIRLAMFLLGAADQNAIVNETHDQIARDMGSAREAVTRMLKRFADEGLVALSRGEIKLLNKPRLKQIINTN